MYDLLKYFTIISGIILIIHEINPKYNIFNIHLTSLITFVFGTYIAYYVNKLHIKLHSIDYNFIIEGNILKLGDFIFHVLPFIYVWFTKDFSDKNVLNTLLLISLYYIFIDIDDVYILVNDHFKKLLLLILLLFCIKTMCIQGK